MIIDDFVSALRARGLRRETIKTRRHYVERALETLGRRPETWTRKGLEDYLAGHNWAPATRRSAHASIKSFLVWCDDVEGAGPLEKVPAARVPRSMPRPASDADILDALRRAGEREQLMIELMCYGGLRRAEVAVVRGDQVEGEWLRVEGKGGHVRMVPIPAHLAARIRRHGEAWLFPGQIDGHLSPRRVGELVGELLPRGVTAHALRHRFATTAYQGSGDIIAVQRLLGHAKLDTTMIYTEIAPAATRAAAASTWRIAS